MAIETLGDIISELADRLGVYGAHEDDDKSDSMYHCRVCFEVGLANRIREARSIEAMLDFARKNI